MGGKLRPRQGCWTNRCMHAWWVPACLQELEAQLAEIERDVRMLSKATSVRISTA